MLVLTALPKLLTLLLILQTNLQAQVSSSVHSAADQPQGHHPSSPPHPQLSKLHEIVHRQHVTSKTKLVEVDNSLAKMLREPKSFDFLLLVNGVNPQHCGFCMEIEKTFKTLAQSLFKLNNDAKDVYLGVYHIKQNPVKELKFNTIPHCIHYKQDGTIDSCDMLIAVNSNPIALAMKLKQMFLIDLKVNKNSYALLIFMLLLSASMLGLFFLISSNYFDLNEFKYPIALFLALFTAVLSSGILTGAQHGFMAPQKDNYFLIGRHGHYLFDAMLLSLSCMGFMYGALGSVGYFHVSNASYYIGTLIGSTLLFLKIVKIKIPEYALAL